MSPRDEYIGDDYTSGDDVLGAVAANVRRAVGAGRRPYSAPPLPAAPSTGPVSKLRSHVGFGSVSWAIADGTGKNTIMEPQESFRVERLIIDTNLTGVTNAIIVQLATASVGTQPQSPSVEFAAPAAMFARDSTYANVDWQVAYRGTKVQLSLSVTAAPAGAAAVASIGAFGEWVR